jgi:hypothetical protein
MRISKQYYAIIQFRFAGGEHVPIYLFWAESNNGVNWVVYDQPILGAGSSKWESGGPYRATFYIADGALNVWYSCYELGSVSWHTAYTKINVGFVGFTDTTLNVIGVGVGAGALKVVGCSDSIGVSFTAYYVGPSGSSDSVNVPIEGYVWNDLNPGSYTVYGEYQSLSRSVTVTVVGQQTVEANLDFSTTPPPTIPAEILVVGAGLVSSSVFTYAFLVKPRFARTLRAKLRIKGKARLKAKRRKR